MLSAARAGRPSAGDTVAPDRNVRAKWPPSGCVLHKATLSPRDVEMHEGFSVTTPLRTLADAATSHGISDEQLIKAVADALDRGMVRKSNVQRMIGQIPRLGRTLAVLEKG